jgi:hypothetical protein
LRNPQFKSSPPQKKNREISFNIGTFLLSKFGALALSESSIRKQGPYWLREVEFPVF